MAVVISLLIVIIILLGFILKVLFAINSNVLETDSRVEAFEKAYTKHYDDDLVIRKTTANAIKKLSEKF